jgi:hypothetical protein
MSDAKTTEQDYGIGDTGERALLLHRRLGFRTLLTIVDSSVTGACDTYLSGLRPYALVLGVRTRWRHEASEKEQATGCLFLVSVGVLLPGSMSCLSCCVALQKDSYIWVCYFFLSCKRDEF